MIVMSVIIQIQSRCLIVPLLTLTAQFGAYLPSPRTGSNGMPCSELHLYKNNKVQYPILRDYNQ